MIEGENFTLYFLCTFLMPNTLFKYILYTGNHNIIIYFYKEENIMERKYECINETITVGDKTLYRIKALKDFGDVKADDLGGFLENEDNLNHEGNCWISDNACVFGNAYVSGDAYVSGNARVYDDAIVFGEALICGDARVFGKAQVFGDARVFGNAYVFGNAWVSTNAKVFDNAWVSGNAKVSGNAQIYNNAKVYNNSHVLGRSIVKGSTTLVDNVEISDYGYIESSNDYLYIASLGPDMNNMTIYLNKDKEILVSYFTDPLSIDDFITKVDELDEPYKTRCLLAVEFGKKVFENNIKN